ncbi:MAG: DegT/DnrJ/EryC1/StrS family aminotransferase, partial [Fidelibacterota bacterium]
MNVPHEDTLAIEGGKPVRTEPFPRWPRPTEAMKESLIHTLDSERWGIGSEVVERFEKGFARFHEAKFALSTNSGTAALWVALKAAGVKTGDEVIVPAYTFVATASAVLMANAIPVFVDIDPQTLNMDPHALPEAVTDRTRVIMPVHLAGYPADMTRIGDVAENRGIALIEDAAQAHGAEWEGRKVGALGLGGVFSFQSSKNMTAGEGGIIVSDDEMFVNACYSYQNVGRVRQGGWLDHRYLGGNFRLSAFPAAILLAQIRTVEQDMKVRDTNADLLDEEIRGIPGLAPQERYEGVTRVSHHLYILRYDKTRFGNTPREEFIR